jgi:hypothetical protein
LRIKIFSTTSKNVLACHNGGVVVVCKFRSRRRIGSWFQQDRALSNFFSFEKKSGGPPVAKQPPSGSVELIEILVLERVCLHWPRKYFWRKKTLVKSPLISTLDKVIYYKGAFSQDSTKSLFTTQNRLETS